MPHCCFEATSPRRSSARLRPAEFEAGNHAKRESPAMPRLIKPGLFRTSVLRRARRPSPLSSHCAVRLRTAGWVGAGTLDVRIDVNETAAVCRPFTSDCGEGAWCPSSGLTGEERQCVAAGELSPGEACAGPLDCAADSSCFDFGQGPVCAALCELSEAGVGCSADAECLAVDCEYGICEPIGGE
jgi:hypothetical protein